jgi:shikimate kinase
MTITLVGYRGTGKSSVARHLADALGLTAVDADALIEQRAGKTIREIFAADGEPAFRAMERTVAAELLRKPGLVIASGGGAVLNSDTRDDMRAAGPVVWLRAAPATIAGRIDADPSTRDRRPALTDHDPREEIARLLTIREPLYREVAGILIDTDGKDVAAIVSEILAALPTPENRP